MLIRADDSRREVVHPGKQTRISSPLPGVNRLMLDRDGGEEFLILDGTFADEHGRYPAGSYVRNPPGSRRAPHSRTGCSLFVKLRQFDPEDRERVVIDTRQAAWYPGVAAGLPVMPLHHFRTDHVALERWVAGTRFKAHTQVGREEVLVLSGTL